MDEKQKEQRLDLIAQKVAHDLNEFAEITETAGKRFSPADAMVVLLETVKPKPKRRK